LNNKLSDKNQKNAQVKQVSVAKITKKIKEW